MQGKSIINKRSAGIIVACLILLTGRINAQHSHSHDDGIATGHKSIPPHGGLVEDAGKYHFEIVFDVFSATQKLSVWTLKSNFKVIEPKEYTGTVKFEYKDGKIDIMEMNEEENERYSTITGQ